VGEERRGSEGGTLRKGRRAVAPAESRRLTGARCSGELRECRLGKAACGSVPNFSPTPPSSWSSSGAWLTPPASLAGSGEKLGTDPRISQPTCCGLCREPFFSGVVGSVQIYRHPVKGCHVRRLLARSVRRTYVDWHGKHMYHVGRVFPYRVYNRRDSRI
jgi:hypothetical protein